MDQCTHEVFEGSLIDQFGICWILRTESTKLFHYQADQHR